MHTRFLHCLKRSDNMDINKDFLYELCDRTDSFPNTELRTLQIVMLYVENPEHITKTTYKEKCSMLKEVQINWMKTAYEKKDNDYYKGYNMLEEIRLFLKEKIIYEFVPNTEFREENIRGAKIEDLYMLLLEKENEQKNTVIKDLISISEIKKYIEDELGYKPRYISIKEKSEKEFNELLEVLLPKHTPENEENVIHLHYKRKK